MRQGRPTKLKLQAPPFGEFTGRFKTFPLTSTGAPDFCCSFQKNRSLLDKFSLRYIFYSCLRK